jgi:hypothetical protein
MEHHAIRIRMPAHAQRTTIRDAIDRAAATAFRRHARTHSLPVTVVGDSGSLARA